MTLTPETLAVLQGGTRGPWRIVLNRGRTINGAAVINADGLRIGTLSLKADKPLEQKRGDARKIALVNQMADVCVKAEAYMNKEPGSLSALYDALSALESARREQGGGG